MAIDIKLGTIEADAIKLGSNDVIQVYLNGEALIDTEVIVHFSMTATAPTQPKWSSNGGDLIYDDNGDGTWHIYSYDEISSLDQSGILSDDISMVTAVVIHKADTVTIASTPFDGGTNIEHIDLSAWDMSGVTNTRNTFRNCSSLICITNVDTTASNSKTEMFLNCTSLQYPDATDQADIVDADGANWVNPNICPLENSIVMVETQNGYCEFDDGGTCTTPSLITSTITGEYTTVTYNWVVIGATIDGSNTEDYITVTTPAGNTDVTYTVQLTATIDGVEYYVENDYTQVKTLAPIRITGISQDVAGSCDPNPEPPATEWYSGNISNNGPAIALTDLGSGDWKVYANSNVTAGNEYVSFNATGDLDVPVDYILSFTASYTSGSLVFKQYYDTALTGYPYTIVEGYNELPFNKTRDDDGIAFLVNEGATSTFEVNLTDISLVKADGS